MTAWRKRARRTLGPILPALMLVAAGSAANAQWFPPIGSAPPSEIEQRLRAEGFILIHPLQRRETVYLADVTIGGAQQRLVLDAWSGQILQRFVARGRGYAGGYVFEGGEFDVPPPLAPPSAREFGAGGPVSPGRPKRTHPHPAIANARPEQQTPTAAPEATAPPQTPNAPPDQSPGGSPAPPATASAPATPESAAPKAESSQPAQAAAAPPAAPTAGKSSASAPPSPATPASAAASTRKKVNDLPVNPLE